MGRASRRKRERLAHRLGVGAAEGEMPSSGKPKTTQEILKRTWDMLETARLGASVATDNPDPRHRISGVRNVIVFGRAVTNVLQNLRATELTFDAWYAPVVQRMETDPLMRFLYELRTRILKQGEMPTSSSGQFTGDLVVAYAPISETSQCEELFHWRPTRRKRLGGSIA